MQKRLVVMCLGPDAGGGFEVLEAPRRDPAPDEIEVAVEAASVNPIDVRRADGYGRRLLSLMGAARFPMMLGNDFAGAVVNVGARAGFAVGDRVYGVKPVSRDGSHSSHVVVKAAYARNAPHDRNLKELAVLPYSFVTMWLALRATGLTRESAAGQSVLVHGAAGGIFPSRMANHGRTSATGSSTEFVNRTLAQKGLAFRSKESVYVGHGRLMTPPENPSPRRSLGPRGSRQ